MTMDAPPAIIQPAPIIPSQGSIIDQIESWPPKIYTNTLSLEIPRPTVITFLGDGNNVVKIYLNGHVEYTGTPDEAAKAFWQAVERAGWCGKKQP